MQSEPPQVPTVPVQPPANFQTEVTPQALQELFARDPEKLSDQDIMVIIGELRKQRLRFEGEEAAKALKPKKKEASDPLALEQAKQLTLDDLEL
jgi:hypothetical protein